MALGASLALAGSLVRRVALVTRAVGAATRHALLRAFWDEVEEVETLSCVAHPDASPGSDGGDCTALAAFSLTRFERLLFMDTSALALDALDVDALLGGRTAHATVVMPANTSLEGSRPAIFPNNAKCKVEENMRSQAQSSSPTTTQWCC